MSVDYIKRFLKETSIIMNRKKEDLTMMDSVFGDGDLGLTMSDGFTAAYKVAYSSTESDCGKVLYFAGKAMGSAVPSTMGTLMAAGLMEAGKELHGRTVLTAHDFTTLFSAWFTGVSKLGKAQIGDKTFLDGLHPAVESLAGTENETLKERAKKAAAASKKGFDATKEMLAVHGRAATRGEKSRGIPDPGAAVAMYIMEGFDRSVS